MTKTCRFVSVAIAAVEVPASSNGMLPATTHLAALAMLIAERDEAGNWRFTLERHAITAGEREDLLLLWAVNTMPESGIVIGWQLADAIVQPLLDAAAEGDPEIARAFLDRFMKLVTAPSLDLAIHHGGAGAPGLASVCAGHGIALRSPSAAEIESAWATADLEGLSAGVTREAVALWRLWLAESNGTASVASDAFAAWLANHDAGQHET